MTEPEQREGQQQEIPAEAPTSAAYLTISVIPVDVEASKPAEPKGTSGAPILQGDETLGVLLRRSKVA